MKSLETSLLTLRLGGEYLSRAPKDWQAEAAHTLGYGERKIPKELTPIRTAVESARAQAVEELLEVSAWILVAATRKAQQMRHGERAGLRFGAVPPEAIRLAIPADQFWLLGLGPKRGMRRALAEASQRRPGELWRDRRGWRSLGGLPSAHARPAAQTSGARRTRSGLPVVRETLGSGG
jgi:hypothetical protein